jgi:hypothetical protein
VGVFGLLFQRPFRSLSSIDRSIVPQQKKSSHASCSIQCQQGKKKQKKRPKLVTMASWKMVYIQIVFGWCFWDAIFVVVFGV